MLRRLLLPVALSTGCFAFLPRAKPSYYSVGADGVRSPRYARVNEYTSFEGLGEQARISAAFEEAEHAPPPARDVEIFNASLPPGARLDGGLLHFDPGSPYEAVGRYELGYWYESWPREAQVRDDLVRLASVTETDAVVVEVHRVAHGDPRVTYMTGFVLRRRPDGSRGGAVEQGAQASAARAAAGGPAKTGGRPAPRPQTRAALAYAGPRGCLTAEEFADEVSARLGYSPWQPGAPTRVEVTIEAAAPVQGHGRAGAPAFRAMVGDGAARRALEGGSCRAVTDAAVAAIVVRLDAPDAAGAPAAR